MRCYFLLHSLFVFSEKHFAVFGFEPNLFCSFILTSSLALFCKNIAVKNDCLHQHKMADHDVRSKLIIHNRPRLIKSGVRLEYSLVSVLPAIPSLKIVFEPQLRFTEFNLRIMK